MKQYKYYTYKDHGQQDPTIVYKQLDFALAIDLCLCQSGKWKVQNYQDDTFINSSHLDYVS